MGKESQVSAMEIDDSKSNNSDQILPKFSVNVLQLLKSAQMQHGLRHGDYTRYRRYCTARLRRLYKSLKFTHGRGKYARRTITESTVTEELDCNVIGTRPEVNERMRKTVEFYWRYMYFSGSTGHKAKNKNGVQRILQNFKSLASPLPTH